MHLSFLSFSFLSLNLSITGYHIFLFFYDFPVFFKASMLRNEIEVLYSLTQWCEHEIVSISGVNKISSLSKLSHAKV